MKGMMVRISVPSHVRNGWSGANGMTLIVNDPSEAIEKNGPKKGQKYILWKVPQHTSNRMVVEQLSKMETFTEVTRFYKKNELGIPDYCFKIVEADNQIFLCLLKQV